MTSLGFLSLPPAKLTDRAAEGLKGAHAEVKRARRQHKNQVLLCYVHTQPNFFVVTLFTELPQEFVRMVTKKIWQTPTENSN